MIETRRLKNVVIFFQTILSFVLSRKIKNRTENVTMFLQNNCINNDVTNSLKLKKKRMQITFKVKQEKSLDSSLCK